MFNLCLYEEYNFFSTHWHKVAQQCKPVSVFLSQFTSIYLKLDLVNVLGFFKFSTDGTVNVLTILIQSVHSEDFCQETEYLIKSDHS